MCRDKDVVTRDASFYERPENKRVIRKTYLMPHITIDSSFLPLSLPAGLNLYVLVRARIRARVHVGKSRPSNLKITITRWAE
jgi:hypothetical protein